MEDRKIRLVKVKRVHPSGVLPSRTRGPEVGESVKSVGVQQPLIVRPIKSSPDEYELINGKIRYDFLDSEQEVYVDIREDATDSDVFKTSEATFQRKDRSAYEKACFYNKWLGTLEKEKGEQALQSQLAKLASLSESAVSQYLAIYDVIDRSDRSPKDSQAIFGERTYHRAARNTRERSDPFQTIISKEKQRKVRYIHSSRREGGSFQHGFARLNFDKRSVTIPTSKRCWLLESAHSSELFY